MVNNLILEHFSLSNLFNKDLVDDEDEVLSGLVDSLSSLKDFVGGN